VNERSAEKDAGLRERLREALRAHDDGMLDVQGGKWVCRCDCYAVLESVDHHEEHRLDALLACIASPGSGRTP
jgi:hypothetical protein